ncbi:DNA-binding GntR family transcriptional regulator [Natranaerovirga hydrolytica]|uniref:DNA-binding GntR family transcriptional regulator n=1 Tax=Natranaerovirga hydrolytica TaxID=680378 RepID=A0A4R1MK30_9FIRM|nr:GntR family transcriptional regulator [Natranaerovirga hydrolytica]TCK92370.1 DNA-binding GntR family transcriptional regulator [Natranaerovirga hydrolytica]
MSMNLKQKAYTIIKNKILNCEYVPNMYLNEELLCKEINASRTPIRDALSRLEQENLVSIIPKKGVLVAPLTINDINMIFETRMLLEPYIIKHYGHTITEENLSKLKDILQDMNVDKKLVDETTVHSYYNTDDAYHRILVELSNNRYFLQCYDSIFVQNFRLRIMSGDQLPERLISSRKEHVAIHNYILNQNYDKASEAMREHLLASKEAALKVIMTKDFSI